MTRALSRPNSWSTGMTRSGASRNAEPSRDPAPAVPPSAARGKGKKRVLVVDDEKDLVVLDLMLPGLDGTEVARRLKADSRTAGIPIVMLTAKGEDTDVVVGLTMGADDYVTKPFNMKILLARISTVLRRSEQAAAVG